MISWMQWESKKIESGPRCTTIDCRSVTMNVAWNFFRIYTSDWKFIIYASLYADCKVQLHYEREVRPLGMLNIMIDIMHRISFKMWHTIVLVAQDVLLLSTHTHTHTTILRPFFRGHPGEPVPEENFWTLWCKGRITEADTQTIRLGATPSRLTRAHLHHPPHIFVLLLSTTEYSVIVSSDESCLMVVKKSVRKCIGCRYHRHYLFVVHILWTRMWANAQRDGRPAEHRWHPVLNAAKFGWRSLLDCCAVTLAI